MTTLPQTTNVRLPQVGVPTSTAAPYASGSGPLAGASFQMSPADVWRIIRANLWLIIILVLVCGAAGYLAHRVWMAYWPSYTAAGVLQIRTEIMKDAVNEKTSDISDMRLATMLRTQQNLLTNPTLFSQVLRERLRIRDETQWIKQFKGNMQDAREDLEEKFRVSPLPDSELLIVRMTCRDPKDAKIIADEIVNTHLEQQRQLAENALSARTRALRALKEDYDKQITDLAARIRNTQMTLAQNGAGVEGLFSAKEAELRALIEGALKLTGEAQEARAMYERTKQQVDAGQTPSEVQRSIDYDPLVSALSRELAGYQIQLGAVVSRGQEHMDVQRFKKLEEVTQQKLSDRQNELRLIHQTQVQAIMKGQAEQKEAQLKSVRDSIDQLKLQHVALSRELAQLQSDKDKEKDLSQQRQQTANILSTIIASQDPVNQTRITWASETEAPLIPSWPKLWFMLPAGLMLGLMLGLGIAFLREFLDDTVRSPRDISRVGQMNLLGIIADEDDDPAVANAKLPIFDAPNSVTAEQFRQVRTRLQHATALETTRSIMVTGPSPLDGKTTVAANLAAGLALNGRKILLVDANFRRPELHRLFAFTNEKGFSDVLNGTSNIDDCARGTRIPNLSVLTSGPKPPNATELFESQLLTDFIERALEEFDHVIFDTGPFLVVSESVAMAPRVDGVVTVVRAHEESRGTLQRMRDGLRQVKAEHIGIVLNAVRAQGGGYYGRNIKTYYTYNNGE